MPRKTTLCLFLLVANVSRLSLDEQELDFLIVSWLIQQLSLRNSNTQKLRSCTPKLARPPRH
jgi:hypothetical protein